MRKENTDKETDALCKSSYVLYIGIVLVAFAAFTTVFLCFPRTKYSELEKRELAEFPDLNEFTKDPARTTADISHWFSDSEPFRDQFMTMSMAVRDVMRYTGAGDEEAITFRPSETGSGSDAVAGMPVGDAAPGEFAGAADENAKVANAGIVIVGSGPKVRALMAYGGVKGGDAYADALNAYADAMPGVNIYAVPVPTATEFYLPAKAAKCSKPQRPTLVNIHDKLSPKVKFVDVYTPLSQHVKEDIYLRTDHHWAPLGGFYAAKQLAKVAGVPFRELSSYDRKVVHGYVGSMYGYSKDIAVKKAPEDFVYYVPKGLNYTTTFTTVRTNKNYQVTGESKPFTGPFFKHYKDGSGGAYCTMMGGDQQIVKVNTGTNSKRRLLIIKDSYGNMIPGYMFYSFGEVHVIDFRYFIHNLKKFVQDNKITDIAVVFNIYNAYSSNTAKKIKKFLTQQSRFASNEPADNHKEETKTKPTEKSTAVVEHPKSKNSQETQSKPDKKSNKEEKPAAPAEPAEPSVPAEPEG